MTTDDWKRCQEEILEMFDSKPPDIQRRIITLMILKLAFISEFISTDMETTLEILEKLKQCP